MREVLSIRENTILQSIIHNFITTASPVGSRLLSKEYILGVSPATVRNVMMDLEDKGYLSQPHTSAGRIPTDKGYRYYVDGLMEVEDLTFDEKKRIKNEFLELSDHSDIEMILDKACEALGRISNLLGLALSPRFFKGKFKKLELVKVNEKVLMVIISIESGLVKTITLEVRTEIADSKLEDTCRLLNERLSNLTLKEIRDTIGKRLQDFAYGDKSLIQQFVDSADKLFMIESEYIHFKGTPNIMNQPEFTDHEKLKEVLKLIDNQKILIHILNEHELEENITIVIGKENKKDLMQNCSLITTTYKIGNMTGTVGVIGPTRMYYPKMISLVDYIAQEINQLLIDR
jgi:heat-inducible transcriptional repressor